MLFGGMPILVRQKRTSHHRLKLPSTVIDCWYT